jgi:hypothetical protein
LITSNSCEYSTALVKSSAILIFPPLIHTGSATTILAFTVTDFLLMVGAGLLIGRNARVLKYYYEEKKRYT